MTTRRIAVLTTTLAAWPWLTGFFWPPFFDLSWDEEVQLRDGRVIVVHLKFTYERLSRFSKYDHTILRNTEMSFDAGAPYGRVTQLFRRQQPVMLDQKDGKWYVVLEERGDIGLIRDESWGVAQNSAGQRVGLLQGNHFNPIQLDLLPKQFDKPNFIYQYGPRDEIAKLDKTIVTLSQKADRLRRYPLGPAHQYIYRPQPSVYEQQQQRERTK